MRIISGSAKGLKLKAPEGLDTRPTIDRIKESLFNIIADNLYDINFLDIFSGSGGIGIEALSRGAKETVFIDYSKKSCDVISYNLKAARLYEKAHIIRADASCAILKLGNEKRKFNIIFMDPPYKKGFVEETLNAIKKTGILAEDGFIIAEQAAAEPDISIENFNTFRIKNYNKIKMSFIRWDKTPLSISESSVF